MGDVGSLTRRKKNVKASAHCKQLSAMLNSGRSLRTGTVTRFAFARMALPLRSVTAPGTRFWVCSPFRDPPSTSFLRHAYRCVYICISRRQRPPLHASGYH